MYHIMIEDKMQAEIEKRLIKINRIDIYSAKEFLEKVKLYLQTRCCIIKSDVEKFFRTDDAEKVEYFQKRGLN